MPAPKGNQYAKGNKGGKGGPGKFRPEYVKIATRLCERGLIDEEIAEVLSVSSRTIHSWKVQHEEFAAALKRTKDQVNQIVEQSLIMRANGFEREVEKATASAKKVVIKEYFPPDVGAQRLWLQNRMPEVYREKSETTQKVDTSSKFLKLLEHITETGKREQIEHKQLLIDRANAAEVEPEP